MRILGVLATGLSLLLSPALAAAQDYPTRSIRLIVPFPPGGPNDIIARVIGQRMSELTGQPVVVDNRGGQGGVLGTDAVAKAAPDGYTIAISSAGALAISPGMEKVAYDTLKDLAPVTLVATVPEMLVVASNVPAKNISELIALAKAQPGKLNFASSGPGSLPHLAGELLKLTENRTVPMRSPSPPPTPPPPPPLKGIRSMLSGSACSAASPRSAAPVAIARAISPLSCSSTSIEMWGCSARKAASVFGRYSDSPEVLVTKRTVAFTPRAKAARSPRIVST